MTELVILKGGIVPLEWATHDQPKAQGDVFLSDYSDAEKPRVR